MSRKKSPYFGNPNAKVDFSRLKLTFDDVYDHDCRYSIERSNSTLTNDQAFHAWQAEKDEK